MKLDLHIHTMYSEDAINCPDLIMRIARRRGMDGVAVTDHNTTRGWKGMQEAAKRHGMLLVKGEEMKVTQDGTRAGEIVGLFLNEEIPRGEASEVIDRIREQDGCVVIPHPFDRKKGFPNLGQFLGRIDAIECLNARLFSSAANRRALGFAKGMRIGMTGGSDAHAPCEAGNAWTEASASDLEGLRKALLRHETRCDGSMISPVPHMLSIAVSSVRKAAHKFEK